MNAGQGQQQGNAAGQEDYADKGPYYFPSYPHYQDKPQFI